MTYILLYQFERIHISIALAYDDRSWTQAPEAQGRDREQDDRRTVQEELSRMFPVRSPFALFPFPRSSSHSFPAHARNFPASKLDQVR